MRSNPHSALAGSTQEADWLRDLHLVESIYGRLVYLAGLIDSNTGKYEHYGLKTNITDQRVHSVLKKCHEDLYRDWIGSPLELKMADVQRYITSLTSVDRVQLIDAWLRLTPYKNLVPPAIQGPDRQRHISDFEAILGLLKNVYGVASPDADA